MRIRAGLIGAGNISQTHARSVRAIPGAELVAVYGANPEKARSLCQDEGVPFPKTTDETASQRLKR